MNRRLYRSVTDRRIGGVAAGTATYFDVDPSIARVIWLLLAIFTGGGFVIVYLVMWAIVPEEPWTPAMAGVPGAPVAPAPEAGAAAATAEGAGVGAEGAAPAEGSAALTSGTPPTAPPPGTWPPPQGQASSGPGGHVILGAILILIGGWFLAQQFLPWLNWGLVWPIGLVVVGVLILLAAIRR